VGIQKRKYGRRGAVFILVVRELSIWLVGGGQRRVIKREEDEEDRGTIKVV